MKFYEENHILPVHLESNSLNLAGVSKTVHASIVMVKIHKNTKHINMLDFVISCLTIIPFLPVRDTQPQEDT